MSIFDDVKTVFSEALHGEPFYWLCSDGHALGTEFAWMPAAGSWVYFDRDANESGRLDDLYLLVTDHEDTSDYPWFENVADLIAIELAHNGVLAVSSDIPDELPDHVHAYRVGAPADGLHKE